MAAMSTAHAETEAPPRGKGALDGVLVIDFTRVIAGPLSTQTLADLGADVIKIEHPVGGDDTRAFAPIADGESAVFLAYNRNKRSVSIDLSTAPGRDLALSLMARADVVVENFSTGVMERLGIGQEEALRANPRLVYCSISGYGRSGPLVGRPGYDGVVQAESGFMSMNGFPDREPVRSGLPVVDLWTGLTASNAMLAALFARERTGRGQYVEVALFDTAIAMTTHIGMGHLVTGLEPTRVGNSGLATEPVGVFQASDHPFQLSISGERVWQKLVHQVLGRPDIAADARFNPNVARMAHRDELHALLQEIFATATRCEWMTRMRAVGVPAGTVRTIGEAMAADDVAARGLVEHVGHSRLGSVPNLRSPIRLHGTPLAASRGAPMHGEHTHAVLSDVLGLEADDIAALAAAGAIPRSVAHAATNS